MGEVWTGVQEVSIPSVVKSPSQRVHASVRRKKETHAKRQLTFGRGSSENGLPSIIRSFNV